MNFKSAMVVVFGVVFAIAWGSSIARAADDEVDYKGVQSQAAAHRFAAKINPASFAKAIALYPRSDGGNYQVSLGNYMMWKVVNLFPPNTDIQDITLTGYKQTCWTIVPEKETPKVLCGIEARMTIVIEGYPLNMIFKNPGQGVDDYADPADPASAPMIRAGMQKIADHTVDGFHRLLIKRGVLEAKQ